MDLLIATAAEDSGSNVLGCNADFDRIASLTGQPMQRVVPPVSSP